MVDNTSRPHHSVLANHWSTLSERLRLPIMHHWTTQEVIPTCVNVNHVYLISVNFWRFIIELFVHRAVSYIYNFVIFSSICCCYRHSISLEINKIFWFRATTPRNWSGLQSQNHVSWTAPLPPVPAERDEEHKRCDHGDGVFCSELVETHLQAEQMGSDKWRFCWWSSSIFTSPHWEAGGEGQKAPLSVSVLRRRSFSQETIYLLITPTPLLLSTALYYRRRGRRRWGGIDLSLLQIPWQGNTVADWLTGSTWTFLLLLVSVGVHRLWICFLFQVNRLLSSVTRFDFIVFMKTTHFIIKNKTNYNLKRDLEFVEIKYFPEWCSFLCRGFGGEA